MPSAIETHPQREKIIDLILAGKSLRDIRNAIFPPVSLMAIQRYRAKVVVPAMANAGNLTKVLKAQGVNPADILGAPNVTGVTQVALSAAPVLAVREQRLAALQDRHNRLKMIVDERAKEMEGETAGGASGFLTRDYKGKDADTPVYKVDTGLLAEFREHEKQAAMELGQWSDGASTLNQQINIYGPIASTVTDALTGEVIDIKPVR